MTGVAYEVRWHLLTREDLRAAAKTQAIVVQPLGTLPEERSP